MCFSKTVLVSMWIARVGERVNSAFAGQGGHDGLVLDGIK